MPSPLGQPERAAAQNDRRKHKSQLRSGVIAFSPLGQDARRSSRRQTGAMPSVDEAEMVVGKEASRRSVLLFAVIADNTVAMSAVPRGMITRNMQ